MEVPASIKEKAWWYARHALTIPYIQRTYSHHQVPKLLREPFIYTGYRPVNKPWKYYLTSLFQIHNDTGNVWSHLLGVFIYIYALWFYFQELNFRDPATWGLVVFGMSIITNVATSSIAHLLHGKSELMHFVFFFLDYVGVGVFGYGMGTMLYYCSGSELFYQSYAGKIFLFVNFLLNINLYVMLIVAKIFLPGQDSLTRKLMFIGSSASSQLFMSIPLWMRLYESLFHENPGPVSNLSLLCNHSAYLVLLPVTAFFFSSFLPERGCPGGYDILGHSHQIFHCLIIVMSMFQLKAGYSDFISQPKSSLERLNPTFEYIFGGYVITLTSGLIFIFLLRNRLREKIDKQRTD